MAGPENTAPEAERQHHRYRGSRIPWYIHLLWLTFWVFALLYTIVYLLPSMRTELLNPP